jgi:hypothetical protein
MEEDLTGLDLERVKSGNFGAKDVSTRRPSVAA